MVSCSNKAEKSIFKETLAIDMYDTNLPNKNISVLNVATSNQITSRLEADATSCAKYLSSDLAFFLQRKVKSLAEGRLEKFVTLEKKTGNQLCELGAPRRRERSDLIEIWLRGREH